jgi:DNA-binding NtrC family response regulator
MLAEVNRNLRIAIIDDQKELSFVYSQIIEQLGYQSPSIFNNGTSIVNALAKDRQSFDIVIMDYQMPEMDGIEAAKIIQRYRKDTKVILATSLHSVKQEARAAGLPILMKPFSINQLAECLELRN